MRELRCPKCGSVFSVDEADYASIVSQVRGAEFEAELRQRLSEMHRRHEAEEQARTAQTTQAWQNELFKRDRQAAEALSGKDREISALKATVDQNAAAMRIAVMQEQQRMGETLRAKDEEIARLKADAQLAKSASELRESGLKSEFEAKLQIARSEAAVRENSIKESMEGTPLLPEGWTILEIKVQDAMPLWLAEILSAGKIYQGSFSKYGEAYRQQLVKASGF